MPKTRIEGWSALEVEMDVRHRTFKVWRRLEQKDLGTPGLRPTFIFYTSHGAQLLVNDHGVFLLRFKMPKTTPKDSTRIDDGKIFTLAWNFAVPKLYTPPNNLKRLAKKAMKQLFASGKVTI